MNEEEYRLAVAQALVEMRKAVDGLAERAMQQNARLDALGSLLYVLLERSAADPALPAALREHFDIAEANLLASQASDDFMRYRRAMFEDHLPPAVRTAVFPPHQ